MELRIMNQNFEKRLSREHKFITKYIFEGLTIAQIASKLNYSESTVANRMNSLFKKYNVKTRIEFIMNVMGEVIKMSKMQLEKAEIENIELKEKITANEKIISKIISSASNQKKLDEALCEASRIIEK